MCQLLKTLISVHLKKLSAYIFYCCTTNYQKFVSLKQYTHVFYLTVCYVLGQEFGHCLGVTAQGFHKLQVRFQLNCFFHLEAQLRKKLLASSFRLLAEFISQRFQLLAGSWLLAEAIFESSKLPLLPCGAFHGQFTARPLAPARQHT